jgi:hypothetical protein
MILKTSNKNLQNAYHRAPWNVFQSFDYLVRFVFVRRGDPHVPYLPQAYYFVPTDKFIRIPTPSNGFMNYGCDVSAVVDTTASHVIFLKCYKYLTLKFGSIGKTSDLYSCNAWFESRPGHRISSLRCLEFFLSPFRQKPSSSSLLALQLFVGLGFLHGSYPSGGFVKVNFSEVGS